MKKDCTRREFLLTTGGALAYASLMGGPNLARASPPRPGGEVNIGVQVLPVGVDWARFVGLYAQWVLSFTHDGLVDLVPPRLIMEHIAAGKPSEELPAVVPNLAESWEISKDGRVYTFNLTKGVHFHNGKEFKSEDVAFCIQRTLSKPIGSALKPRFETITDIKLLDDHNIRITLEEPLAPFLSYLCYKLPIYALSLIHI